jgi:hypothetical protein
VFWATLALRSGGLRHRRRARPKIKTERKIRSTSPLPVSVSVQGASRPSLSPHGWPRSALRLRLGFPHHTDALEDINIIVTSGRGVGKTAAT